MIFIQVILKLTFLKNGLHYTLLIKFFQIIQKQLR